MQSPLVNPAVASFRAAKNARLFKIERSSMKIVGEYVYVLDDPRTFRRDPSDRQSDVRISELMAVGHDRLVVDERTDRTTKLYEINLNGATNILDSKWDDPATRPTLEQAELIPANIKPLPKILCLDALMFPGWKAGRRAWHSSATVRSFSSIITFWSQRRAHANSCGSQGRYCVPLVMPRLPDARGTVHKDVAGASAGRAVTLRRWHKGRSTLPKLRRSRKEPLPLESI
jgi:hypothetical protein